MVKRIRGKRARSRQHPRHDLRGQYRESDLAVSGLSILTYDDPYEPAQRIDREGNVDVRAQLEPVRHADGSLSEGQMAWTPPPHPLVTVVANLREDPLGRLYARKQINQAAFLAGREYQENYDAAVIGSVRSVDLTKTHVSGGLPAEPLTDRQRKAAAKLRGIEAQVQRRYGDAGLWLVRLVLGERRPLEATAKAAGAATVREVSSWCWLFRKCLDAIALVTGFISGLRQPYRPPRSNGYAEENPAEDRERMAADNELFDLKLRYGLKRRPA